MTENKSYLLLLFLLIGIGAAIRLWNIGFQIPNFDEMFTIGLASPGISVWQVIISSLTSDFTPPLYYVVAHYAMIVFGAPYVTAIRIPSAIFGILTIPVMFYIGKEYKDELFGILMAGFTTIFYNAFFYSRFGRAYAMELLLFSITFYYFVRLLKGDKYSGIGFGLCAVASIWTHLYAAIPVSLMVVYLIWEWKGLDGVLITIAGAIPLAYTYIPLVYIDRSLEAGNQFGATLWEILILMPLDIFAYSAFAIVPIIVWQLWKHRDKELFCVIAGVSLFTWISMFWVSLRTPVILHYAIVLVPMLMIPFIEPFWEAIKTGVWYMRYILAMVMVVVLELYQIVLLNVIQRCWGW